jgi:hypothetical protein
MKKIEDENDDDDEDDQSGVTPYFHSRGVPGGR